MHSMLLGYSFQSRPNSSALATVCLVMTIGISINRCLHSKKPVWRERTRLTSRRVWCDSGRVSFFPSQSRRQREALLAGLIIYNYPPKGRWIVVDTKYIALWTNPEGDSRFNIYQISGIKIKKELFVNNSFTPKILSFETVVKREAILNLAPKQWISKDILSYGRLAAATSKVWRDSGRVYFFPSSIKKTKSGSACRVNNIQLSPKGEVNSGGNIYRDAKRRSIYLALWTDPEGIVLLVFTKSVG